MENNDQFNQSLKVLENMIICRPSKEEGLRDIFTVFIFIAFGWMILIQCIEWLGQIYLTGIHYFNDNPDYILSIDFLVHVYAFIGFLYFTSKVYVPVYKLLQSFLEIIIVLPIIVLSWSFTACKGTLLFVQKALVRPWSPTYENGAPTIDNPLGK